MFIPGFIMLLWFGPVVAILLVSLVMEQGRHAPNGTDPQGNLVLRSLVGGIVAVVIWILVIGLLIVITRSGKTGLWIVATPWAFAIGQVLGLFWRNTTRPPPS